MISAPVSSSSLSPRLRRNGRLRRQAGVTLTETLLVLALAALLAGVAYQVYGNARDEARLSDMTMATLSLVSKIEQLYGTSSDFEGLDAELLAKSGQLPPQFRVVETQDETELRDLFGNTFTITGTSGSYAFQFSKLNRDTCSSLATSVAAVAHRLAVGSTVRAEDGVIDLGSTGHLFKDSNSDRSMSNLVEGCSQDSPSLAAEIR